MSKYLTIFNTEAQWQAAQDTLDYPNVSLIDTTGDLHYSTYTGKEVANAPFGSILMAEVATNKLFYISESEYNLTDYPIADFDPIGICIYDKASNPNNQAVFMSIKWMSDYSGNLQTNRKESITDEKTVVKSLSSDNLTVLSNKNYNSIYLNNYILSNNINLRMVISASLVYTNGTSAGDWYLPSDCDLNKYLSNFSELKTISNNLHTKNSNLNFIVGNSYFYYCRYVKTGGDNYQGRINHNSKTDTSAENGSWGGGKVVYIAGINEL